MDSTIILAVVNHLMIGSHQTRRYWYNIDPITIQIYVLYGQETSIYTIFNRPKGICTAGQRSGFCWPVHDVLCGPNQNNF